jgi:predicted AlkP superfamily phosphohydrolase/phosphomutase
VYSEAIFISDFASSLPQIRRVTVTGKGRKVFIVSLDGATFDVLRPLESQGYLPTLGKLMASGIAANLESVIPPVTAPAWTSFMTGKTPGKHGIFDFTRFDPQDRVTKLNNAEHIRSKTLWQILSEKGKRVIVVNLPYTYPPSKVNGVMVSGWDVPSQEASFTYPESLRAQIFEKISDYGSTLDLSLWNLLDTKSDQQFELFISKLVRSFQQGFELASFLLHENEWDVCMVHFQQTDWIQHKLWNYIEEACRNSANKDGRIEKVRQCYREFDQLVGKLLQSVEPLGMITVVLSDHGFGRHRGSIFPNYFLREWGYFDLIEGTQTWLQDVFRRSRFRTIRQLYDSSARLKHSLFDGRQTQKKFNSWGELAATNIPKQKSLIDWKRTKVAAVEGSETAHLFVNVVGRGSQGIVPPGVEYESLVSELVSRFRDLRHSETGEKLLSRVARGSEIYPHAQDGILLPDIVLIPHEGYGVSLSISEAPPKISNEGSHRHNGVLLMQGHGLKIPAKNFSPNLIDISPTVLHLLGLPVPSDMDGRVLEEIFSDWRPVEYEDVDNRMEADKVTEYTAKETELIEQRLRGLGYVE